MFSFQQNNNFAPICCYKGKLFQLFHGFVKSLECDSMTFVRAQQVSFLTGLKRCICYSQLYHFLKTSCTNGPLFVFKQQKQMSVANISKGTCFARREKIVKFFTLPSCTRCPRVVRQGDKIQVTFVFAAVYIFAGHTTLLFSIVPLTRTRCTITYQRALPC